MHNKYPKGSEWGKWDLHIHTPASILESEYKSNWDSYIQTLFRKAIENDIVGIGITDYYFVDGYKKLKNEYLSNPKKMSELFSEEEIIAINNIFIFPNLEFRINKLVIGKDKDLKWNRKVNFHVLLSNEIAIDDIEENLLSKLTFEETAETSSPSQKTPITKRNLIRFGARLKKEQTEFQSKSDLYIGTMNVAIDETQLVDLLTSQNETFKCKYLLGLPSDEDLSRVNWTTQGHIIRKVLIQKSHFLFSSNPNTIKFGLGKFHNSEKEFIEEFRSLKSCLWGSDAHSTDKLFLPDNNRNTWIKSNPTFEGLRQVIFEPEERVKIQENIPGEKTPYLVIDKIRFRDAGNQNLFPLKWIEFNQNLNAIIGGKSSGKSLLLYHIAKALVPDEVSEKTILVKGNSDYSDFIEKNPFDLEVCWKNGDVDKLSETEKSKETQITYIPQLYINHLAEEEGEEQLKKLINSILKQNENFSRFFEGEKVTIRECKTQIQQSIEELLQLREEARLLIQEKREIGNKEKINAEIVRLSNQIDALRKSSGFTQEENERYEKATNKNEFYKNKCNKYLTILTSLQTYQTFYNQLAENLNTQLFDEKNKYLDYELEKKLLDIVFKDITYKLNNVSLEVNSDIVAFNKKVKIKYDNLLIKLKAIEGELKPFQNKALQDFE